MKILVVGNYYYPEHIGGVEVVSYNLVRHYKLQGEYVRWMAADVRPTLRTAGADDVPVRAWNIAEEKLGFPHPIPHPHVFKRAYDSVKWCDAVHLHDCLYPINWIVFVLAKLFGKPVLITQHVKYIPYAQFYKRILQQITYPTLGWLMFNLSTRTVFVTEVVRDSMAFLMPDEKQEVIVNGVDTDSYAPVSDLDRKKARRSLCGDEKKPIILFVGRMVERKGIHLLRPLIGKHPEWFWVLAGRPDDFDPSGWGFSNLKYVRHALPPELRELYASADVLVHPSVGEGVTLTVSECLACGTPVIISEESIANADRQTRELLFSIKPDTAEIESALMNVLTKTEPEIEQIRTACRDYALRRLSWDGVARKYLDILKNLKDQN